MNGRRQRGIWSGEQSMTALNRKLMRDLWHIKGQALAIGLVIACGVATFVMSLCTLDSIRGTRRRTTSATGSPRCLPT